MLYVEDESIIPDIKGAVIAFSGTTSVKAGRIQSVTRPSAGMETLKRFVSSDAFSVIVLSGFTDVLPQIKPSAISWLLDHLCESGILVIITGKADPSPVLEGVTAVKSREEIEKYLMSVK